MTLLIIFAGDQVEDLGKKNWAEYLGSEELVYPAENGYRRTGTGTEKHGGNWSRAMQSLFPGPITFFSLPQSLLPFVGCPHRYFADVYENRLYHGCGKALERVIEGQ